MKRIDAWALVVLVARALLIIPAVHQNFGITEALANAWGIFTWGTSVHVVLVGLLYSAIEIAVAVLLFLWARRIGEPAYLWALLGFVGGITALLLFLVLRLDEIRAGVGRLSLRFLDPMAVLVGISILLSILMAREPQLRGLLLGQGDAVGAFGVHQLIQTKVAYALYLAVNVGITIWLARRAKRYGSTPVLPFLVGITLGMVGAVLLELWHLWRAMGGAMEVESRVETEDA